MNQYIIEKLKEGRLNKGLKQSDVTKLTGIKNTTLSNYENGNTEPDMDTFLKLCHLYELDYAELLGEAYGYRLPGISIDIKKSDINMIKKYRNLDIPGRNHVDAVLQWESERMVQLQHATALSPGLPSSVRLIQYYQHLASAGNGEYLFDDIPADLIAVPDTPISRKADFVIGVSGDSMAPTYHDGDKVYVQKVDKIPVGSIGIFVRGTDCFIKELGSDRLISHNKEYPDIPAGEDIRLVGMVLGKVEDSRE